MHKRYVVQILIGASYNLCQVLQASTRLCFFWKGPLWTMPCDGL